MVRADEQRGATSRNTSASFDNPFRLHHLLSAHIPLHLRSATVPAIIDLA